MRWLLLVPVVGSRRRPMPLRVATSSARSCSSPTASARGSSHSPSGLPPRPAGIGFLVGGILILGLGSIVPVSFEVESLTVVSRLANRDWLKMCYIVLVAGVIGFILGLAGVYGKSSTSSTAPCSPGC